jgi:hypothetical protein
VFSFVESQFAAVFCLGIDLLMLVTVSAMANKERSLREARGADRVARSSADRQPLVSRAGEARQP